MIGIAIAFDQPGVAARIAYHGVGEFVKMEELSVEVLTQLIQKVLTKPTDRDNVGYFQKKIAETSGVETAADIIERVFNSLDTSNVDMSYIE